MRRLGNRTEKMETREKQKGHASGKKDGLEAPECENKEMKLASTLTRTEVQVQKCEELDYEYKNEGESHKDLKTCEG